MATKLKGLSVTSVDLVDQGANPDAHIRLFKRGGQEPEPAADPDDGIIRKLIAWLNKGNAEPPDGSGGEPPAEPVGKDAASFSEEYSREQLRAAMSQMYDCCYALSDSFCSIISDKELDTETKKSMILTSLDEFTTVIQGAAGQWAAGQKTQDTPGSSAGVQKSTAQQQVLENLLCKYDKGGGAPSEPSDTSETEMEETDTMKIDKSKMTPEEQATLAELEKKYGIAESGESGGTTPAEPATAGGVEKGAGPTDAPAQPTTPPASTGSALHPDVAKALSEFEALKKQHTAEIEELKKSLEIERLTAVAKKYEIIGKKADELAAKLYDLKKAGGTVYDDYIALLDENLNTITKSGLFGELGSNRSGSAGTEQTIGMKAAELAKSATSGLTTPEAIIKAWEENPELAAQYEAEYTKGW